MIEKIKKITQNKTSRFFTFEMTSGRKYRTVNLTKKEFESELSTTKEDWESFLETDIENYYEITKPKN